jgi:Sgf11 (transcriptional regulation protein)
MIQEINLLTRDERDALLNGIFASLLDEVLLSAIFDFEKSPSLTIAMTSSSQDKCVCFACGNLYLNARYAPHLEKCLGMGRQARNRATVKLLE